METNAEAEALKVFSLSKRKAKDRKWWRRVSYLRKPPVSDTMASVVMAWTVSSITLVRAWASALLTALEMSP